MGGAGAALGGLRAGGRHAQRVSAGRAARDPGLRGAGAGAHRFLRGGDHLVGHSYGGVVSLLAAAEFGEGLGSLAVLEPPALAVARGEPAVDAFVAEVGAFFARGPHEPRAYLEFFLPAVGSPARLKDPLPEPLERGARAAMAERPPWEAEIPLRTLAEAGVPALVVSGAHHTALDAVCDVLEHVLGAQRAVVPGAGHAIPRLGAPLNDLLQAFVSRARR